MLFIIRSIIWYCVSDNKVLYNTYRESKREKLESKFHYLMQNRTILVSSIIFSWCHFPILSMLTLSISLWMRIHDYRITNLLADMNGIITVIIKPVTKVSLVTRCQNALDEIICEVVNYRTNSNWQQSHISIETLSIITVSLHNLQ